MHKGLPGLPAHKSRTLSHAIEVAFKPDNVQNFPGKDIQTTTAETVSQHADTLHKVPQRGSHRPKSLVALNCVLN